VHLSVIRNTADRSLCLLIKISLPEEVSSVGACYLLLCVYRYAASVCINDVTDLRSLA